MKKLIHFIFPLLLLSCSTQEKSEPTTNNEEQVKEDSISSDFGNQTVETIRVSYIAPLDRGFNPDSVSDFTLPASFKRESFNWRGSNLKLKLYTQDIYDAVEISQITNGDTIFYDNHEVIINTIKRENGQILINDEAENDAAVLVPNGGGTYRAIDLGDVTICTDLGEYMLMLSENFTLIDCGENPTDKVDTITSGQKAYLDELPDYRGDFSFFNTTVTVENGEITEIHRRWTP